MDIPLVPTVSYDVWESRDSENGTNYEIFHGNAKIGFVSGWKRMVEFFSGRINDGFRDDIPVNLYLGDDHGGIVRATIGTVAELK